MARKLTSTLYPGYEALRRQETAEQTGVSSMTDTAGDTTEYTADLVTDCIRNGGKELEYSGFSFVLFPPVLLQLKSLCELNLSNNQLTDLPLEVSRLVALEMLNLDVNFFSEIPHCLSLLPSLRCLCLNGNVLTNAAGGFACKRLESLFLANNYLRYLPNDMVSLRLKTLVISKQRSPAELPTSVVANANPPPAPRAGDAPQNQFGTAASTPSAPREPETPLTPFTPFSSLDVTASQVVAARPRSVTDRFSAIARGARAASAFIVTPLLNGFTLGPGFMMLTRLETLALDSTDLKLLPHELGKFVNLRTLRLECNAALTGLPESIGELTALSATLILSRCALTSIPEGFGRLTQLQRLFLDNNRLESLHPSFGNLLLLTSLDLSHNKFQMVPHALKSLTSLESLRMAGNQLGPTGLGADGLSLPRLKTLDFSICGLVSIELPWELPSISTLNLAGNMLTSLPDQVVDYTTLTALVLHNNPLLRSIPRALGCLKRLRRVDIDGCSALTFPPEYIAHKGSAAIVMYLKTVGSELSRAKSVYGNAKGLGLSHREMNLSMYKGPWVPPPLIPVRPATSPHQRLYGSPPPRTSPRATTTSPRHTRRPTTTAAAAPATEGRSRTKRPATGRPRQQQETGSGSGSGGGGLAGFSPTVPIAPRTTPRRRAVSAAKRESTTNTPLSGFTPRRPQTARHPRQLFRPSTAGSDAR